jgi:hypothetical protein
LRDGLRRLPALDLQYNPLSTARRQPGILMHVHPVLRWTLKLQQPQLPRSEPDGQPTESSQLANRRYQKIISENVPSDELHPLSFTDPAVVREGYRAAEEQARQELGDVYKLIDIGEPATIDGLMKELDIKERLDGLIDDRCLKRLLMVRGIKSLSSAPSSVTPQISSSRKAG